MTITDVPLWVNLLFGFLFFVGNPILFGHFLSRDLAVKDRNLGKRVQLGTMVFIGTFLAAIAVATILGVYSENILPPRILLFGAFPLVILWIVWSRTSIGRKVYETISLESLISVHLFRFVGAFFFIAYYYDALPKQFAFLGGGGDLLTAILVFPVLYALKKKWKYAYTAVFIWNIIGLLDILSVLINAIYFTQLAVNGTGDGVIEFATFPFSWIPAFAPATIIFLHVIIFRKLLGTRRNSKHSSKG